MKFKSQSNSIGVPLNYRDNEEEEEEVSSNQNNSSSLKSSRNFEIGSFYMPEKYKLSRRRKLSRQSSDIYYETWERKGEAIHISNEYLAPSSLPSMPIYYALYLEYSSLAAWFLGQIAPRKSKLTYLHIDTLVLSILELGSASLMVWSDSPCCQL